MITIQSYARVPGKKVEQEKIPVEIYGHDLKENMHRSINKQDVFTIRKEGKNVVVLIVDGVSYNVLIKEVQYHPVKNHEILNICFFNLSPNKSVKTNVKINFLNAKDSEVLKAGGVLNIVHKNINVYCPGNMVLQTIDCDVRDIKPHKPIMIRDLPWPKEIWIKKNIPIASVVNVKENA